MAPDSGTTGTAPSDNTRTAAELNAVTGAEPHASSAPPAGAGRYTMGDEIARGGMGEVYRATDTTLGREVAAKVLQARYAPDSATARRFRDEARIAAQLQHPGIPPVHDLGVLPDGRPFLAMKLIKGDTLDALLARRQESHPEFGRFVAVFEHVCQAVAYAHAHGVIHRDLKPANVMVGSFGEVQVMDWGLAKVLTGRDSQAADPDDPDVTRDPDPTAIRSLRDADTHAGSILGTPAFMPPEQAAGAVGKIDARSDVFGLGAILAVILTGRPPFASGSTETTRVKAAQGDVADCFARLDECGAEPELVALCKRCLSPRQEGRPADAGRVAEAVASLRTAADERARRAEVYRAAAEAEAKELRKRRRVQFALAASVTLLLISIGGGMWWADRLRTAGEFEKQQIADRGRFEKLQIVTTAVARLEQLRDQGREQPAYAQTIEAAKGVVGTWERTAFALDQASDVLDTDTDDPAMSRRIGDLRRDITAGVRNANELVARTGERIRALQSAHNSINRDDLPNAQKEASRAVALDPSSPEARLLSGDIACRQGEFAAAAESYKAALPLAEKHMPALRRDVEVRIARAEYMAGPGTKLLTAWNGQPTLPAVESCDLAELCLLTGYYERAVGLYESAFRSDPRVAPAHRVIAALAATLGGCGMGRGDGRLSADRRARMRGLAKEWLPTFRPSAEEADPKDFRTRSKDALADLIRLEGFDPARYRFVRGLLPPAAGAGEWKEVRLTLHATEDRSGGVAVPERWLVGGPYPGATALKQWAFLADDREREVVSKFLNEVIRQHLLYDLACKVFNDLESLTFYQFLKVSSNF